MSYNNTEMKSVLSDINNKVSSNCCNHTCYNTHNIDVSEVEVAVKSLKPGKSDGTYDQKSNHIINGPKILFVWLSLLFNGMLRHGIVPSSFLVSSVIPIPKCKNKSLNSSENYRGIALSSLIGKLFDLVVFKSNCNVLRTSDYQFGFKKGHSTQMCSFAVNEVVQYYSNKQSNTYVMLLDASKAFDRVEYVKLFKLLLKKGLCSVVARVLASLYMKQSVKIKWGSSLSREINISNGVKQGGILSPILFVFYIDELLLRLKRSRYGCHIGDVFMGCFSYADDVALVAPSMTALRCMLQVADEFADEYSIKFNVDKYQFLPFEYGIKGKVTGILHKNMFIKSELKAYHLGNLIGQGNEPFNVMDVISKFNVSFNGVLSNFKWCRSETKYKLFKSFCMPLYGSVLWDYSGKHVLKFFTQWRKCIRVLWGLPSRTHSCLLPIICNDYPIEVQLHKRVLKFVRNLENSENKCVKLCFDLMSNGSGSSVSRSLHYIVSLYNITKYHSGFDYLNILKQMYNSISYDVSDQINAGNVQDLCYIRDSKCTFFTLNEINSLLEHFCMS